MQIVNLTGTASQVAGGDALFGNVPQELRELRQWVVWRATPRPNASGDNRIAKPPMRLDNPAVGAVHTDPSGWGTFDEAVSVARRYASTVSGIGLFLTRNDPYVCVDVDDESKVEPQYLDMRRQFVQELLGLGTYLELSPSKNGLHVWMRGQTEAGGKHNKRMGSEVYAFETFVTVTGDRVGQTQGIADCQEYINRLGFGVTGRSSQPAAPLVDDPDLPLDLPDQEVVQRARNYVSWFSNQFDGKAACDAGDWSHTFIRVLGVLAKVSGSVEQLWRITYNSGMVQVAGPAASGETRPHKARRTFAGLLQHVRAGNRGAGEYFREHGKAVWAAIEAETQRRQLAQAAEMQAAAERLAAEMREAEEAVARDGAVDLRGSAAAKDVLGRFAVLGGDPLHLSVPPGRMGELVMASMRANPVPYLKYALPAALATISGIIGRAYAPDRGGPLNMNYILVAPSSTGKTVSMDVWNDFLADVNRSLPVVVKPVDRLIKNSTMSVQGIWPVFEEVPSCVWFIEEAATQLNGMSAPKSSTDENLSDFYKQLYDSGKHGKVNNVPRSAASRNSGFGPIEKLCVSTYWTTTPDAYELKDKDINGGLASRAVFVHHDKPGGAKSRYYDTQLPEHLKTLLRDLLIQAGNVDRAYSTGSQQAYGITIFIDTRGIDDAWWELDCVCDAINREAILGTLPKVYQAMSRVPMNARRMACALAVVENPWQPRVTVEQLTWCHNYLVHNAIGVLAATDAGEAGDNSSDEVLAAKRIWRKLVKQGAMNGLPGVPRTKLFHAMRDQAPFRSHRNGRGKAASDCVKLMLDQHLFQENTGLAPAKGRPASYILLVDE